MTEREIETEREGETEESNYRAENYRTGRGRALQTRHSNNKSMSKQRLSVLEGDGPSLSLPLEEADRFVHTLVWHYLFVCLLVSRLVGLVWYGGRELLKEC